MTAAPAAAPETFDLVIGVGHPDRGDDGVGPYTAGLVTAAGGRAAVIHGNCLGLLDLWAGTDSVAVVDAATGSGSPPGTLHRFEIGTDSLPPALFRSSSHLLGPAEAIGLAEALGRLPARLVVFAIEAAQVTLGAGLSPPVQTTAEALAARLAAGQSRGPCL